MQTTKLPMISVRQLRKLVGRRIADLAKNQPVKLVIGNPQYGRARYVWLAYRHAGVIGINPGAYELLPDGAFENFASFSLDSLRPMVAVSTDDFSRANLNPLYLGV